MGGQNGVISPEDFFGLEKQPDVLLICVYVADQVVRQVKEAGYTGEVVVFSPLLLLDTRKTWEFYEANMDKIEKVYSMLADEKSQKTVEGFLNSIRSGNVAYLEEINGDSRIKGLDPVLLQYTEEEVYADIGAFTGDTILEFLKLTEGKYKRIVGFELDRQNYSILAQTTDSMKNVDVRNVAVGAESGKIQFSSGHSESSCLSDQGDSVAEMVALDDIAELQDVTFIKASVNGAEFPILQGAKKLLKTNKPKLAVYASGDQLWKVPLFLKEIVPDYLLYFRHYGYGKQAMVCYAVKK